MRRTCFLPATVICLSLVAALATASPVLVEAGFDSGTFTLDDLDGQNGWSVLQGTATVQNTVTHQGDQAVSLASGTVVDRSLTAPGQSVVWTESYFRGAGTTTEPEYPSDPASAIVHFSANDGILLLNGDGSGAQGAALWDSTSITSINDQQWYRITIRQDYTNKTWDCWINGSLEGQDLGFRDNSVNQLNGFRQYAGVPSYLDTFLVRQRSTADLNLDGVYDAADVVLNVDAIASPPSDLFAFDDADFDANGTIDQNDVDDTVDTVLGDL